MRVRRKHLVIGMLPLVVAVRTALAADPQYAGVVDAGVEDGDFNGQVDFYYSDGEDTSGRFTGTNLGSDNLRMRGQYGEQGKYKAVIEYDKIPRYGNDGAQTIFQGVGSDTLSLPDGWVDAATTDQMDLSTLKLFDMDYDRKRFKGDVDLIGGRDWNLKFIYRRDKKEGKDKIAGAVGGDSGEDRPQVIRFSGASTFPEPIDQVTDQAELVVNYQKERYQLQASVRASRFDNEYSSLTWENPFLVNNSGGTGDFGRLATDPDNEFYQAMISGGYSFSPTTRLTGVVSRGVMRQDKTFLPYSIDSTLGGELPADSLDGEVYLNTASLRLTGRPTRELRLKAAYRYHERDNDTDKYEFMPVVIDYQPSTTPFTNQPYSYRKQTVDLSGHYRMSSDFDFGLEYEYDDMKRWSAEREDSDEHTFGGILNYTPASNWDAFVSYRHGIRDGGTYIPYTDPDTSTNPLLRKYNLANRDRDDLAVAVNYMPSETVTLAGRVDYIQNDYDDTEIGLTETEEYSGALDVTWVPRANTSVYGFLNYGHITSDQAGADSIGSGGSDHGGPPFDPTNWFVDSKDTFTSVGFGVKFSRVTPRLDIGMDYTYSESTGEIKVIDEDTTGGGHEGHVTTGGVTYYPDLKTKLNSFQIYGRYRYSRDIHFRVSYLYEKYDSSDWAFDDVGVNSVPNVLLVGEEALNYKDNIFAASVVYYFR